MKRTLRLALGAGLVVAATVPMTQSAQAVVCPPPVMSTVCWAHGTVCRHIPSDGTRYDLNALLCTVAA